MTFACDLASIVLLISEGTGFYPWLHNLVLTYSSHQIFLLNTYLFPLYFLLLYRVPELLLILVVTHCFSSGTKSQPSFQMEGEVKKNQRPRLWKKSSWKQRFSALLSLKHTLAQQFFASQAYTHKSIHVGRMSKC